MLGIIGGTGLYSFEQVSFASEEMVDTPFGPPSAPITLGSIKGVPIAFLPRHGVSHQFLSSEVNYRANIWALKQLGATALVSVSTACSLQQEIVAGHIAVSDQCIDLTGGARDSTFFGHGIVAHVSMVSPVCRRLMDQVRRLALSDGFVVHRGITAACVQGPRGITRAESLMVRGFGADIVCTTIAPEMFLAREAQLCFASLSVITEYAGCLQKVPTQERFIKSVAVSSDSMDRVRLLLEDMATSVQSIAVPSTQEESAIEEEPAQESQCGCRRALAGAILNTPQAMSQEAQIMLEVLER